MHFGRDFIFISASPQISSLFLTQTIQPHNEPPVSASCKTKWGQNTHTQLTSHSWEVEIYTSQQ